jgi:hypothetical protein
VSVAEIESSFENSFAVSGWVGEKVFRVFVLIELSRSGVLHWHLLGFFERSHRERRAAHRESRNLCAERLSRERGRATRRDGRKKNCRVGRGERAEFADPEGLAREEREVAT